MVRFICERQGFTLIELSIVMLIIVLVIGGVMFVYTMSTTAWKEGSAQIILQREGSIAMEKMVRGINGTNGIREAGSALTSVSNTKIEYTSGIDDRERSFRLSGSEIKYDPNTIDPNDVELIIAEHVTGLEFTISGDIVTIELSLMDEVVDRPINVDLSTNVRLRN